MLAKRKHFSVSTYYSSYSSSAFAGWTQFYFGIVMVVFVVFCLLTQKGSE
jgi:hypothetical protein